ncbi:MAG: hypothetical protein VB053_02310 [Oscillibacter ruminantium]|uniref:hypothetical protein n=1 Tax=Oscillibacter ruminantium TaxID=1263547 RepID=UPI002B21805C|nr:hypothetical protein [Oscillibacter ruminantium]MEA5041352.1 hypothetical protein [Oscillibacter ruminantium]
MEFMRFIFSSFWIWAGFVIIIACTGDVIVKIITEIKKPTMKDIKALTIDAKLEDFQKSGKIRIGGDDT